MKKKIAIAIFFVLIPTILLLFGYNYLKRPKTLAEKIAYSIKIDTSKWNIVEYRDTIKPPKFDVELDSVGIPTPNGHRELMLQRELYMNEVMMQSLRPKKIRMINKDCNILILGELLDFNNGNFGATLTMITPQKFSFNEQEQEIIINAYVDAIVSHREEKENARVEKIKSDFIAQHEKEGMEIANKLCK